MKVITSNIKFWLIACLLSLPLWVSAQGWPSSYKGVMLQGFYWDSYDASSWTNLEKQVGDFEGYFDLIWVPQSGKAASSPSMGYDDKYWFTDYTSSFGTEAQLRSMISTFKTHGIGTIADVVINHRANVSGWFDFPSETYKDVTYSMGPSDVCANDDSGKAATEAAIEGVTLSSNNDSGEDWSGMRDLDHASSNVQKVVKAYLGFLLNDLGYAGFRYDMVKGYAGKYTGIYNTAANSTYSVGEYWDGDVSAVETWLNSTKVDDVITSAAFDFPFRYTVRDAINNSNWSKLGNSSLMSDASYRQYAVTFVENHDTEYRSSSNSQDPIKSDTLAANAFLLAMPGTPCVFYKHYLAYPQDIKAMIDVRKAAGISNTSTYTNLKSEVYMYANEVKGENGNLVVAVGNPGSYTPGESDWTKVLSGDGYSLFLENSMNIAFVDKPSGTYDETFNAMLTAVSNNANVKLVYTTDGSTPTASSTAVTSGTQIEISESCTLKVGLLIDGVVSGVISRTYTMAEAFNPVTIQVYVNADEAGASWAAAQSTATTPTLNFWTWGGDGSHAPTNTSWPGDAVTTTETVYGTKWFVRSYTLNSADDYVSFVFSVGTGTPQTEDITRIQQTSFLKITSETDDQNHYKISDVTTTLGISSVVDYANKSKITGVYSIDGRRIRTTDSIDGLPKGCYIVNGKKIVIR